MIEILKIYTYVDGINDTPFPNADSQLEIADYTYTSQRMGDVSLTATIMYKDCLDDIWTGKEYVAFQGEKYFIKDTPTSSKDNEDVRYKHELNFVSERTILDMVYFFDVVTDETAGDRYQSNSTKVLFYGDIEEFVNRLNYSMEYSNVGYDVVIDSGIVTEIKLVSFEDKYISDAIQEIYNIFELPYYFVGKTIHVGYSNNIISTVFKYGIENSLLSITKNNANSAITNRGTGVGSSDNIPYYYPNVSADRAAIEAAGGTWITPSQNLMPPIYRESFGANRFYNALNDTYINPQTGLYYEFENIYDGNNPKESKQNYDYIKPSITGMTNATNDRIDQIMDVAFDTNDSDEIDITTNGYKHPYFFVKLRKFNGAYGFNLFEQSIEKSEMSITMTDGACNACNFIIDVDSDTQKNIVQVDSNGNLLRDENGDVVRAGTPQDRQNDTENYEVWIALRKDDNTLGLVMPNSGYNYKPQGYDTFVLLGINLPNSYILSAENKLKEAIIRDMADNNREKFTFSINFSRIFLQENASIISQLNENAKIKIEYNNGLYELYISTYTYKADKGKILPEITVDIQDTVTASKSSIKSQVNESVSSIGLLLSFFSKGSANTAWKLRNTQTLWGQPFNGTQNISGDLKDVGRIIASGNITTLAGISAGGISDLGYDSPIIDLYTDWSDNAPTNKALSAELGIELHNNKVDKVTGYSLSKNDLTDVLLSKLNGIDAGANLYVHPTSGITSGTYKSVTVDANGHVTAGSNPTTLAGYGITDAASASALAALDANVDVCIGALAGQVLSLQAKNQFDELYSEYAHIRTLSSDLLVGYLKGNADTASKLLTARTIWGQSFDGTSDVNEDLHSTGNISAEGGVSAGGLSDLSEYGSSGFNDIEYIGSGNIVTNVDKNVSSLKVFKSFSVYSDTEIGNILSGSTAITGYNKANWDTAYGWGNHASAGYALAGHNHNTLYQPLDADLTAIAGLAGTSGFLKKTAANTWSLDTKTYLTGNQTISLTGIITGSGTTSIATSIADAALSIAKTSGLQTALNAKMSISLKGAPNGIAELDSNGLVPASQLPSYVDDVLTYSSLSVFPSTGVDGKIYIASDTNLTYRWSGTSYVEISKSLALGEGPATAYRGDRGKVAYDHSQITGSNPHGLTKSILGLNYADGAQVNVLEGVKLNGTPLSLIPTSKVVNVNACTSISVPTGLSVAALDSNGLITISLATGYAIPMTASITQIETNISNHDVCIGALAGQVLSLQAKNQFDELYSEYAHIRTLSSDLLVGYLKGNADTATKLLTARTIWGQSFDGTANVTGNMTGVGSVESNGDIHTSQRIYGDAGVFSGGIGDLSEYSSGGYNEIVVSGNGNAVTSIDDSNGGSTLNVHRDITFSIAGHTHAISEIASLQSTLNAKEATIAAGTTAQYWRGDKSWQTLNTSVVPEGTNIYYTNARVKAYADTLYSVLGHTHSTLYQPLDADLTAITGLAGTSGFLKKTAANTWSLDTNVYLTGITKAQVEAVLTGAITTHTHNYQAPLTGTGFVKSAAGVISYDTNTYLTTHQTIYGLTIQKNGDTIATYTPNSAAKTINISDVASATSLDTLTTNTDQCIGALAGQIISLQLKNQFDELYAEYAHIRTLSSDLLIGALKGNADTATKLQTERTLTIGNTGKTFNGTANVSWSAAEMGVLPLTGGTLTGNLTAPTFIGALSGNASTATAFQSAKEIALTGDISGSASSTGGWSIATTIGAGKVTNAMLAGSIDNSKLSNSAITISGQYVSLGGKISQTALRKGLGLQTRATSMNGTTYYFVSYDNYGTTSFSTYAPTTAGASGQLLISTGATPSWVSQGAGGGIDADKLDNMHAVDFVNVASAQTITGAKTFSASASFLNSISVANNINAGGIIQGVGGVFAGGIADLQEDSWTTSSLINGTHGTTYGAVRYRRIGTNVQIDGSFTITWDGSSALYLFNLPSEYRPSHNMTGWLYNNDNGIWRYVVGTNGRVTLVNVKSIVDGSSITTSTTCIFDKCIFPIN